MDIYTDSLYEIFLFLDIGELVLCSVACWDFYNVSRSDSLWRRCIDKEYKELFGRETWYETCKMYHQMDILRIGLKESMPRLLRLSPTDLNV